MAAASAGSRRLPATAVTVRPKRYWPVRAGQHLFRRQLLRFIVVGGICFLLNTLILYAGTEWLHIHYLLSLLACFVLVNAVGFLLNGYFTFGVDVARRADRWLGYYLTMAGSLLASLALFYVAVDLLGIHYLAANAVITAILFAFNYLASRRLVYSEMS